MATQLNRRLHYSSEAPGLNLICEITILAMRSSKTHFGQREELRTSAREIHHSLNSLRCRSLSEIASNEERVKEREERATRACFKTVNRRRFIILLSAGLDDEANDVRRCGRRDDLSNLTERVKDEVREDAGKRN